MALGLTPKQIIEKGSHPLLKISEDWERVELENIAKVQNGYAFSSKYFNHNEGLPLIRIRDIFSEETENLYSGEYKDEFVVKNKDFLVGMDGDFKISKWPGKLGLLNQRVCRIQFNSEYYVKEFLFLSFQPYLNAIHSETSAVTVKHLSSKTIQSIPFPLPPLPIQRAIVKKIEGLFSALDAGIADLQKAQTQLALYRQAVLKKAFEGEQFEKVEIKKLGLISTGNTPSKKNFDFYDSRDFNFYKPTDLEAGVSIFNSIDYLSLKGFQKARQVPENSVLITCIGATIGKTGLIKKEGGFNQQINAIVPNQNVDSKFIYYQAISQEFQTQMKTKASSTTMPILNKGKFEKLEMNICSLELQHQIVKAIESRLSVCEQVETQIKDSLEKAEVLRQSILKKAFEGKLLTEAEIAACKKEPDYEPAAVLLEKIKAEKITKKK